MPEFIQEDVTAEGIAQATAALLDDVGRRDAIASRFAKLRSELALDSDRRAADAVIALAQ